LGLASLFACCFVQFSLRSFGIRVATLFTRVASLDVPLKSPGVDALLFAHRRLELGLHVL
jgi:hypothetical protein